MNESSYPTCLKSHQQKGHCRHQMCLLCPSLGHTQLSNPSDRSSLLSHSPVGTVKAREIVCLLLEHFLRICTLHSQSKRQLWAGRGCSQEEAMDRQKPAATERIFLCHSPSIFLKMPHIAHSSASLSKAVLFEKNRIV